MEEQEEKKEFNKEELKKQIEEKLKKITDEGVQAGNLEMLYKLIDIHKDMENEEYWKTKKEVMEMNYREYGEGYNEGGYGRGGYGNYGYGEYGRRGVPGTGRGRGRGRRYSEGGSYQGEEMMNEMYGAYQEYSEGRERFGNHPSTMKSLDYMLKSVKQFLEMLREDAGSQEEMQLIQKYTREISEM